MLIVTQTSAPVYVLDQNIVYGDGEIVEYMLNCVSYGLQLTCITICPPCLLLLCVILFYVYFSD